jgi:thymidylate synthase ThyX
MKIIEPYIEHWKQGDDVKAHVAKCARVCYDKETGNDDVTINTLLKKHHWSMFRHESVYVIGEFTSRLAIALERYSNNPYINWTFHNNKLYIATNGNFCLDLKERQEVNAHAQILLTYINYYRVSEDTFFNDEIGYNMMRYTFCIVTQISTSRELNRVSPNNIAEQSMRYVYKNDTICRPHWLEGYNIVHNIYGKYIVYKDGKEDNDINHKVFTYFQSCKNSFDNYRFLVNAGLHRQDARGVLPIDTATKCIYTYSINEWKHIIKLRSDSAAHPNAQIISNMIKKELEELGYEFN